MTDATRRTVLIGATVGAGLLGGVYFSFSTFVMPGLRRLGATQAIAAMQQLNKAAPAPWVITGLLGTGGACAWLAVDALRDLERTNANWQVAGSAMYLATVVSTIAFHVPRNEALNRVSPTAADAAQRWHDFVGPWTTMNHVRTALSLGAAAVLGAVAAAGSPGG